MNPHQSFCNTRSYFGGICDCREAWNKPEPLAPWERELLGGEPAHIEGYGDVTFVRTDGRTVLVKDVAYDGIGPDAGTHGVVSMSLADGTIKHLPFIESWTVETRV